MVKESTTGTVAVIGDDKGDAKATASAAAKVMWKRWMTAAAIGDGSSKGNGNHNSERQWQQ